MQIERELKEKEIVALFDALAVRFQAISEINLYLANRFNVFNYVSPDESKLSDIIRDLLDPQGDHGQGDLFLNIFLRLLKPDAVKMIGRCAVNREELTRYATNTQRRIDLLLELDGFGIGIENKPWAGEQPGWVKDYSDHLSRRFNGNYLLVFLTRTNREPSKDDARACKELANNFKTIYYEQEFKYWLEESSRNCRADKVRRFLTDFIEYVQDMGGTAMASEHELRLVTQYLHDHPESFRAAYSILRAWPDVVRGVAMDFLTSLKDALRKTLGDEWKIEQPAAKDILEKEAAFKVYKKPWRGRHFIAMQFDEPQCADLAVGVCKEREVPSIDGLHGAIAQKIGLAGTAYPPYWEWSRIVQEYRNWNSPQTMELLTKDAQKALDHFVSWFISLRESIEFRIDSVYGSGISE